LPARGALGAGAELGIRVPSDWPSLPRSGSVWLGVLCSLDLMTLVAVPLRAHANLSFYEDNSRRQYDFTGLPASERQSVAFAYGMGASRLRIAFGTDAPLERWSTGGLGLRPFAEYHLEVVTADPDHAFLDQGPYNRDQQWLTFGARMRVHDRIMLDAGVDLLIRSVGFAYGPPLPPYKVVLGASVPFLL
jgi:hypothetical protein